eukprot:4928125-Amphidinium_carterae.3
MSGLPMPDIRGAYCSVKIKRFSGTTFGEAPLSCFLLLGHALALNRVLFCMEFCPVEADPALDVLRLGTALWVNGAELVSTFCWSAAFCSSYSAQCGLGLSLALDLLLIYVGV